LLMAYYLYLSRILITRIVERVSKMT
jgi:hypothetical protein